MLLKQELNDELKALIRQIEAKTSAELVCVVAKSTVNTRLFCVCCAFVVASVLTLFTVRFGISAYIFSISFFGVFLVLRLFPAIFRLVLPRRILNLKSYEFALNKFNSFGFNDIKTGQALMFFVSLSERYACVIAGCALKDKVSNSEYENIINDFVKGAKNGEFETALLKAVRASGEILATSYPAKDDDENEIVKEVIELD